MSNTILLIEDNPEMRENTKELLELAGYSVTEAINGKDGLEKAHNQKPDLILCDVMMPELDGYGVLRAMNNVPHLSGVPFVFLTAKSEKSDFRLGMDLGADDYLTKPFEGDELLRVVEARIRRSNLLKKKYAQNLEGLDEFMAEAQSIGELVNLSSGKTVKKLRAKDMVYMEGDTANYLFFVVSGRIKTSKTNEWGKELLLDIYSAGDFFGYQAMLEEGAYQQSAQAIENSEVALIPKKDFLALLYSSREVSLQFIRMMSNNMNTAETKLLKLAYDSARKRVAEALLLIAKKYEQKSSGEVSFPGLRENISGIAGISPESVSRNLTDFREEGLIETDNGEIRIPDIKKLEKLRF
ncbi:MAG TPA: response regulator [Bacteroidia bacterium]|nr:response regulator [Bacteroidia bacterium]